MQDSGLEKNPLAALVHGEDSVFRNAKLTIWPNGEKTLTVCDRAVYRVPGWEDRAEKRRPLPRTFEEEYAELEQDGKWLDAGQLPPDEAENVRRAVRRAKSRLRSIARANDFAFFITLTLSPQKVNRYADADILRRLSNWLRNASARHGLAYALVPERHKDGALHFHGLINDALETVDSGTIIPAGGKRPRRPRSVQERAALLDAGGKVVYNLPQWRYGHTTAIRLYGEYSAAVNYVCKYIGKDMSPKTGTPEKIGGRWVYSGGPLKEPETVLLSVDFDAACRVYSGDDFEVRATGDKYHVIELEGR